MIQRCLASATSCFNFAAAGNVDSQYFVGSVSPFGHSITTLDGLAPYHLIAILGFDSGAAVQAALASPQGKVTADDLANFATGGVEIMIADTTTI